MLLTSSLHITTAGGLGNQVQAFEVAEMEDWQDPTYGNTYVPQISLCRGPGRFNHIWGIDTAGNTIYARAGSLLQYSYDGNLGDRNNNNVVTGPVNCDNPTYPGEQRAAGGQTAGAQKSRAQPAGAQKSRAQPAGAQSRAHGCNGNPSHTCVPNSPLVVCVFSRSGTRPVSCRLSAHDTVLDALFSTNT
jgi:hypothetical protein